MKEEHVNETGKEINSIKRQIFRGVWVSGNYVGKWETCAFFHWNSPLLLLSCNQLSRAVRLVANISVLLELEFPTRTKLQRNFHISNSILSRNPIRTTRPGPLGRNRSAKHRSSRRLNFVIIEISENNRPFWLHNEIPEHSRKLSCTFRA
jgi:hypothetical protein